MSSPSNWNIRIDGKENDCIGFDIIKEVDVNSDGLKDLIVSADCADNNSRTNSGSLYIIYNSLLNSLSGTGNVIDLANSSNWNIRIDGSATDEEFSGYFADAVDLNNDGNKDLVLSAYKADKNSRPGSGSIYVLYNSLFAGLTGTGNTIDLNTSTNYNLRFDGEATSDLLGDSQFSVIDLDQNGNVELIITAPWHNYGARADSGAVYVFKDTLLATFTGTGNNVDLATSTNYNIKYVTGDSYFLGHVNLNAADLNNDNKPELILGAPLAISNTGYLYIVNNDLYNGLLSSTGNIVDLLTSTNYTIRYDGAATGAALGNGNIAIGDYNNDSKNDIIVGSSYTGNGAIYVLLNSLINTNFSGTGNIVNMGTTTNFNLRIDGQVSGVTFPTFVSINGDYNGDGKTDLITSAVSSAFNSLNFSGAVYVVYNSMTDTSTGNIIPLSTSSNYAMRYDGAAAVDGLGYSGIGLIDYNNDGRRDVVISTYLADNTSVRSGSFWLIYNFPHTITINSVSSSFDPDNPITGSVNASNSSTAISGVEYQVDTNSITGTWTACNADDGSFNSTSESFSCNLPVGLADGSHTVYVRSYDANSSYTNQSSYASVSFTSENINPADFSLVYPLGYLNSDTKPTLVYKKSSDASGIGSYTVTLDTGRMRSFIQTGIPASGDGSASYVWRDNNDVNVKFLNENTADSTDDEIKVYFKGLNIQDLTEGKHSWNVLAYDTVGNSRSETQDFYIDKTAPGFANLAIANVAYVKAGKTYRLTGANKQFSIMGKAIDPYVGSQVTYSNGLTDTFEKTSSGPFSLILDIKKQSLKSYVPVLNKEYIIPGGDIVDSINIDKSASFYITIPSQLSPGFYRISLSLKDGAGNIYTFPYFYIQLSYTSPRLTVNSVYYDTINRLPYPRAPSAEDKGTSIPDSFLNYSGSTEVKTSFWSNIFNTFKKLCGRFSFF